MSYSSPIPLKVGVNTLWFHGAPDSIEFVVSQGGTVTGGELWDFVELSSATNPQQGSTIGHSVANERGVGIGSIGYYKFTTTTNGTIRGKFDLRWEER